MKSGIPRNTVFYKINYYLCNSSINIYIFIYPIQWDFFSDVNRPKKNWSKRNPIERVIVSSHIKLITTPKIHHIPPRCLYLVKFVLKPIPINIPIFFLFLCFWILGRPVCWALFLCIPWSFSFMLEYPGYNLFWTSSTSRHTCQ